MTKKRDIWLSLLIGAVSVFINTTMLVLSPPTDTFLNVVGAVGVVVGAMIFADAYGRLMK